MSGFELEVGSFAAGGGCVGRAPDGRVVFVRHALPGERVRVEITAQTSRFLRADAVEVLAAAPDRVTPACPYAGPGRCGGCDLQHASLPRQRELKAGVVAEQLRRLAGVDWAGEVEAVPGDAQGLAWRTRMTFAVDRDGRPGLHRHRSRELEHLDRCWIAAPGLPEVLGRSWPGARTVAAATTRDGCQGALAVDGRPQPGQAGLRHEVHGRRFEVRAGGFWQAHRGAAALLSDLVLAALDPQPGERAADLYAGSGLFAARIAEQVGASGRVLAVESDARAAADCARNVSDLPWVAVRTAVVTPAVVRRLAPLDLVVLDPPRAGAGLPVAAALARLRPRALAWVSCDAAAFGRDLRVLLEQGWGLRWLRAFDAYPMTEHVETVALLTPAGPRPGPGG